MKEVFLDEKLSDKVLKALFVFAKKSSGLVENCDHGTSCTFTEEMEEEMRVGEVLNLLSGFAEAVVTIVKRACRLRRISQKRSQTLQSASPL